MSKKIYIIAGEPSGDFIGSKLIRQLKISNDNIRFKFIGGDLMEKETQEKSLFPISNIAIMGLLEVLSKVFTIKKLMKKTIEDIKEFQPDMIITIDSLGFNGRIIKELKKQRDMGADFKNTKFVHYVAPTVWAFLIKKLNLCVSSDKTHNCNLFIDGQNICWSDCHLLTRVRPGLFCISKYHTVTTTCLGAILLNIFAQFCRGNTISSILPTLFCQQ